MKIDMKKIPVLPVLIFIAVVLVVVIVLLDKPQPEAAVTGPGETVQTASPATETTDPYAFAHTPQDKLVVFARLNGLSIEEDWPEDMLELLVKNPDAVDYVLNYPLLKGTSQEADLSDLAGNGKVPQLYQWDERWGYSKYGGKEMGLTGCGPTCLSMVCLYFLGDAKYTPRYVADFADDHGYYTKGVGTEWSLMYEGAKNLGLNVEKIPPNAKTILSQLKQGNLVILAMGPGDFTTTGHYILLAGEQDGKAIVHDPNSSTNTAMLWDLTKIRSQIENLWVYKPVG